MGTKTKHTQPRLWEHVKAEVTAGDRGGRPGQWSARKAQLAVLLYKQAGGGYIGPKDPDNSLTRWTKQDWRTRSGRPSLETGERYLPAAAIEGLSTAEYAATTQAKRRGMAKGQQFVPQPKGIARKTAPYRRNAVGPEVMPEGDYLYHATHLGKAGGIANGGLRPSGGSQFSGGYSAHSRGRVFLTDFDGLSYWMHKMELIAQHNSDFDNEDDVSYWAPVALRILINDDLTHFEDTLGNRDNTAGEAYYTQEPILPGWIEVWTGTEWVDLDEADLDSMAEAAIGAAEWEDDPDDVDEKEPQGWFFPDFELFSPPDP